MAKGILTYSLLTLRQTPNLLAKLMRTDSGRYAVTVPDPKCFSVSVGKGCLYHKYINSSPSGTYTDYVKETYTKNFPPLSEFRAESGKYILKKSAKEKLIKLGLFPFSAGKMRQKVDIMIYDVIRKSDIRLSADEIVELSDYLIMNNMKVDFIVKLACRNRALVINFQEWSPDLISRIAYLSSLSRDQANFRMAIKEEKILAQRFPEFSVREIGMICLGCFTSKQALSNKVLRRMIASSLLDNMDQVNEEILTNITKLLVFSKHKNTEFYSALACAVLDKDRILMFIKCMYLSHFIRCYSNFRVMVYNPNLLETVAKQFIFLMESENSQVRVKDLERFLLPYAAFCYHPSSVENIYSRLVLRFRTELKARTSQESFKCLADFLHSLCILGVFPQDLISYLNGNNIPESLQEGTYEKCMELLSISSAIELDCPEYSGNKLTVDFLRATLQKWRMSSEEVFKQEDEQRWTVGLAEIYNSLMSMIPNGSISYRTIVPYISRPDFEVHLDVRCNPVPFEPVDFWDICGAQKENQLEKTNVTRLVVQVIASHKVFDLDKLHGLYRMKTRHLQRLGYIVITILPAERHKLRNLSEAERQDYLKQLLQSHTAKK